MKKWLIGLLLMLPLVWADELDLNPDVPEIYVVQKGDTLWDIAKLYLSSPWKWSQIWYNNPQIDDPNLIYPGDRIGLVWIDGQRRLTTIERGVQSRSVTLQPDSGTVKLTPQVRFKPIYSAIPAIARDLIQGFLSRNLVIDERQLSEAAYVLSGDEGRLLIGAGDRFYARGAWDNTEPNYELFRPGQTYIDPDTQEVLGYEAIELGIAELRNVRGDTATLRVRSSNQSIRAADRLLSVPVEAFPAEFVPNSLSKDLQGVILAVMRGVKSIGQYDVVVLNKGLRDGLQEGNLFRVWSQGKVVIDPVTRDRVRIPSEIAGTVMVFRLFDKLSYGIVLESFRPMAVADVVRTPGYMD